MYVYMQISFVFVCILYVIIYSVLCIKDHPGAKPLDQIHRPVPPTSRPDIHAHHKNPHNLEEGSAVQYGNPPRYGVIKWIGEFPNQRELLFAGLDMVCYYMCTHYIRSGPIPLTSNTDA